MAVVDADPVLREVVVEDQGGAVPVVKLNPELATFVKTEKLFLDLSSETRFWVFGNVLRVSLVFGKIFDLLGPFVQNAIGQTAKIENII